jgi:membrane-associated phospholipid phosphatase
MNDAPIRSDTMMHSTPANRPAWIWLLPAVLLIPACYAWIDRPLALFFHARSDSGPVHLAQMLTTLGAAGWWISGAALLYLVWRWLRPSRNRRAAGFVAVAVAVGAGLAELLEKPLGRARPRLLFEDGSYGFAPLHFLPHYDSFPSSHAAGALAAATAIALVLPVRWRWQRIAVLTIGAGIAFTRVVITAHFLGDALAGGAMGCAAVLACHWLAKRRGWL